MKLVMTVLVKNEADILDAQLAFHLNAGVDYVIATDHSSTDGTREILERYARDGYLRIASVPEGPIRQSEWVTEMARQAATELGADWVINADADEFWWPRGGTLKDIFAGVPRRFGIVRCFEWHFAPRPEDGLHFAERMTARVTPYSQPRHPGDPFGLAMQVVHRADPDIEVVQGNHDVVSSRLRTLRGWYPIEVLHFPLRSFDQASRKFGAKVEHVAADPSRFGTHTTAAVAALGVGRFDEWYERYLMDGPRFEHGLSDGGLRIDTRLRDALRALAGSSVLPPQGACYRLRAEGAPPLPFRLDDLREEAVYAHELQPLHAYDGQVRMAQRLAAVEGRIGELERGLAARSLTWLSHRIATRSTRRRG